MRNINYIQKYHWFRVEIIVYRDECWLAFLKRTDMFMMWSSGGKFQRRTEANNCFRFGLKIPTRVRKK